MTDFNTTWEIKLFWGIFVLNFACCMQARAEKMTVSASPRGVKISDTHIHWDTRERPKSEWQSETDAWHNPVCVQKGSGPGLICQTSRHISELSQYSPLQALQHDNSLLCLQWQKKYGKCSHEQKHTILESLNELPFDRTLLNQYHGGLID